MVNNSFSEGFSQISDVTPRIDEVQHFQGCLWQLRLEAQQLVSQIVSQMPGAQQIELCSGWSQASLLTSLDAS